MSPAMKQEDFNTAQQQLWSRNGCGRMNTVVHCEIFVTTSHDGGLSVESACRLLTCGLPSDR